MPASPSCEDCCRQSRVSPVIPGAERASRNLGQHAMFGQGRKTLEEALAQPLRSQRGGRRRGRRTMGGLNDAHAVKAAEDDFATTGGDDNDAHGKAVDVPAGSEIRQLQGGRERAGGQYTPARRPFRHCRLQKTAANTRWTGFSMPTSPRPKPPRPRQSMRRPLCDACISTSPVCCRAPIFSNPILPTRIPPSGRS